MAFQRADPDDLTAVVDGESLNQFPTVLRSVFPSRRRRMLLVALAGTDVLVWFRIDIDGANLFGRADASREYRSIHEVQC